MTFVNDDVRVAPSLEPGSVAHYQFICREHYIEGLVRKHNGFPDFRCLQDVATRGRIRHEHSQFSKV